MSPQPKGPERPKRQGDISYLQCLGFRSICFFLCLRENQQRRWWIMNKCLGVPGGYFFDDYPIFAPEHSAEAVDRDVSRMLDLLAWKHAKSGSKGRRRPLLWDGRAGDEKFLLKP